MGLAVIAMIVVAVVILIAIPVLIRVFSEAAERNPNRPGGENDEGEEDQGSRSGPRR